VTHFEWRHGQRPQHHGQVPETPNKRRLEQRPWQKEQVPVAHFEWRHGQRPGHHGQAPARRRGQLLRHHDQVSATHNERRCRQRHRHQNYVPATHNERYRGQRPLPIPGTTDLPLHHKRPQSSFVVHAPFDNKQNITAEVRSLSAQCACVGPGSWPELACCLLCSKRRKSSALWFYFLFSGFRLDV
jgi:hypothetical protein